MIDPDDLSPGLVARRVLENLGRETDLTFAIRPNLDGVVSATEELLAMLPLEKEPEGMRLQFAEEYLDELSF